MDRDGCNRRCTQLATRDQLISLDGALDTNLAAWRAYCNLAKERFTSKMPGVWSSRLFALQLPYRNLPFNRAQARPNVPADAECELCGRSVDVEFEYDHVQPHCYAGESGDMQWLCAACNHRKSNRLQGYRLDGTPFTIGQSLRHLLSEFSNDVLFRLVECEGTRLGSFRPEHCFMSEDNFHRISEDDDHYYLDSIDCCKQYTTACYTATHRWPQFSKLDPVEEYVGQELKPGAYFVTKFCGEEDLTWEGPRWYLEPWVDYHLNDTHYIDRSCISHVIFASYSCDATLFCPLIDELFATLGPVHGKIIFLRFLGLMEIVQGSTQSNHFITPNPQEAFNHVLVHAPPKVDDDHLQHNMVFRRCGRKGMSAYYEVFTDFAKPKRTRLHLPMACQFRTYSAIWLSRFLHEHFPFDELSNEQKTRANQHLVAVFRDQVIFYGERTDMGEEHPLIELSKTVPDPPPPRSWWIRNSF